MKSLKLKLEFPRTVQTAVQAAETTRASRITPSGLLTHVGHEEGTLRLTNLMLVLQKLIGATLGGIAVSIMVGNVLICSSILLLGADVTLSLLPQ
jgi:hypothetical protein